VFKERSKLKNQKSETALTPKPCELIARNRAWPIEKKKKFQERRATRCALTIKEVEKCQKNSMRAIEIKAAKAFIAEFPHYFE